MADTFLRSPIGRCLAMTEQMIWMRLVAGLLTVIARQNCACEIAYDHFTEGRRTHGLRELRGALDPLHPGWLDPEEWTQSLEPLYVQPSNGRMTDAVC